MAKHDINMTAVLIVAIVAIVGIVGLMGQGKITGMEKITGFDTAHNITERIEINCTTWIAVIGDTILDLGSGFVEQGAEYALVYSNGTTNVNWGGAATIYENITIENKGNNNVNLTLELWNDTYNFLGTAGNSISVAAAEGEAGSCVGTLLSSWTALALNTPVVLCDNFTWPSANDEIVFYDFLNISKDTPPGYYAFNKEIKAVEVYCNKTEEQKNASWVWTDEGSGSVNGVSLTGFATNSYDVNSLTLGGAQYLTDVAAGPLGVNNVLGFYPLDFPFGAKYWDIDMDLGTASPESINNWPGGYIPTAITWDSQTDGANVYFLASNGPNSALIPVAIGTKNAAAPIAITKPVDAPFTDGVGLAPACAGGNLYLYTSSDDKLWTVPIAGGDMTQVWSGFTPAGGLYGLAYRGTGDFIEGGDYTPNGNFATYDMTDGNDGNIAKSSGNRKPSGATWVGINCGVPA